MEYELLFLGFPGTCGLFDRDHGIILTESQSVVCIVAIQACKSMGLIKDLAKFDNDKAKRCMFWSDSPCCSPH